VRTHYPRDVDDEIAIVHAEATAPPPGVQVHVPRFLDEVLAELAALLRDSSEVNQRSGVSVRYTIGAHETAVAGAVRRAARAGSTLAVPRVVDLWAVVPAALGRVEFDLLEEGREEEIVARALQRAILTVWRDRLGGQDLYPLVDLFDQGLVLETSDVMAGVDLLAQFDGPIDGLHRWMRALGEEAETEEVAASVVEFVLEGLHLGRRLNKQGDAAGTTYAG
jgi:magnesium chelatase subunit I